VNEAQPASSVIVVRDAIDGIEVYMLKRSRRSAFMPEAYVFPGGRVDSVDRSPSARMRVAGEAKPNDPAFLYCAARETFEEAGILLASTSHDQAAIAAARAKMQAGETNFEQTLDLLETRVDARSLVYFSRWITPPAIEVRRFDTRFFIARMPADQTAEADAVETSDGVWIRPADAIAASSDAFTLVFPTIKHLTRIAPFRTVDALVDFARTKSIVPVTPDVLDGAVFALPRGMEDAW
jgi:8-oxo-dGTP pyrophosphatase MutT (NUDIX family)